MNWLTRLLPRIYLVSLLQLLVIATLTVVVGWLTFRPVRPPSFEQRSQYTVATVAAHIGDGAALQRELDRARAQMDVQMSLYTADGKLVASNVQPPIRLSPKAERRLPPPPPVPWLAPLFVRPVFPSQRVEVNNAELPGGYMIYLPPPPHERPAAAGLWLLGIALAATAAASVWLARSLVRPITQLQAAAKRFGAGDLAARAALDRRDELGELSQSFDEMAERVMRLVRSRQELLANVSHELRTPLARIRVALDLASDGDSDIELQREALGEIADDCAELERLVADVLQLARLELSGHTAKVLEQPLHLERFDASLLVQRTVERFRAEHPQRSLELRCPSSLPEIEGDFVLLRRALHNLLDNAVKYSAAEAPIVLSVARGAGGAVGGGRGLTLRVDDRGIGIAAHDLPHIGTPFFRTDRSRTRRTGGIGLGLSLTRKIVEAHGGSLVIESERNRGTSAMIHLPTARETQPTAPAAASVSRV